jgi:hypothetical protein
VGFGGYWRQQLRRARTMIEFKGSHFEREVIEADPIRGTMDRWN